jgi:hypothetical protein
MPIDDGIGVVVMEEIAQKAIEMPSNAFKYQQLCLGHTRLPVNRFSKNICQMESPGKYEENETNGDLLQSTVQKLPLLRKNDAKTEVANLSLSCFFSKWVTFEPLIVEGCSWSQFVYLFQEIPFRINFRKSIHTEPRTTRTKLSVFENHQNPV